ncbi:MAG: M28 family peptidase [Thainema sp.]
MRRWKWIILAIAVATLILVVNRQRLIPQAFVSQTEQLTQQFNSPSILAQTVPPSRPQANLERIMGRLQDLAFERYTKADRDFTLQYLIETIEAIGWVPEIQEFDIGTNLVATQPNADPNAPSILIGAHYDTVAGSPGVDDNASGLVAALEIAELLNSMPNLEASRQLKLVFFDLEELGLQGSQAYVAEPENRAGLEAAIILDMIGHACYIDGCQQYPDAIPKILRRRSQGDFIAVIGGLKHSELMSSFQNRTDSTPVEKLAVPIGEFLPPDLMRSDHAPFWQYDIPAALVTDTANFRNPHYHQSSDTIETIDPPFLTATTQTIFDATLSLLIEE